MDYKRIVAGDCYEPASWLTVNVCPATVIVPLRAAAVVFGAMLNATVPLPVPLPPLVTEIQGALLAAVQAHVPPDAVTAIDPLPPPAVTDCEV